MNRTALFRLSLALIPLAALLLPPQAAAGNDPSRYRDKNRLLLVFAPSQSDPRWQKQNALLARSRSAFRDRDLLRFDYFGRGERTVRERYGISSDQFRVLLIGKDGHVASRSSAPVTLDELMGRIDAMPMRREEMHRRQRQRREQ